MKLPHADEALIDAAKLRDYSLNLVHPEGKHKARVFAAALGFSGTDSEKLRAMIVNAISTEVAVPGVVDEHGTRYIVDFATEGLRGIVTIRTADNRQRQNDTTAGQLLRQKEVSHERNQSTRCSCAN